MGDKICKHCLITAHTKAQIKRIFGMKLVNNKSYPQSDCKICRKGN